MELETNQGMIPALTLMGSPGCGKGTQSKFLQKRMGFQHISTGDLCRVAIGRNDPQSTELQALMDAGKLVPDELITTLLTEELNRIRQQDALPNGIILDGFPRNIAQAKQMGALCRNNNLRLLGMIYIYVPEEIVFERMMNRTDSHGNQRTDDQEQTIRERIRVFHEKTFPIVEYYRHEFQVIEIGGLGTPEEVFQRIVPVLQEWMAPCSP